MKKTSLLILSSSLLLAISCNQKKEVKEETVAATETTEVAQPKTYAEISVKEGGKWNGRKYEGGVFVNKDSINLPAEHTDHSWYIRYEGPGWESNKIGYRLYLDWRNAIDIYGKKTYSIVLPQVGQDGFESYHHMSDWGMDILKVKKGLGIGSIGRWVDKEVLHFNNVEETTAKVENNASNSTIHVNYKGWETAGKKTDLSSTLTIFPDDRYTKHTIQTSEALEGISTGIVKLENTTKHGKTSANKKWAYIATYGVQTLVPDHLGMAIFYPTNAVAKTFDWEQDHLIEFKPTTEAVSFYFLGAWEKEKNGIKTEAEFIAYLDQLLERLDKENTLDK